MLNSAWNRKNSFLIEGKHVVTRKHISYFCEMYLQINLHV